MDNPNNVTGNYSIETVPVSTAANTHLTTEGSHYSPTDFDGDYHVEQDDETDG